MLLDKLSLKLEDENSLEIDTSPEDVTLLSSANDDVKNATETEEIDELIFATEEMISEAADQNDVMCHLTEQVNILEKKENDDNITPEDVMIAQEALVFSLGRLAVSSEAFSNVDDLRRNFKINTENKISDTAKRVVLALSEFIIFIAKSIRNMFSNIITFIKKLIIKIGLWFSSITKTITKLKGVCSSNPDKVIEKDSEAYTNMQQKSYDKLAGMLYIMKSNGDTVSDLDAFSFCNNLKIFTVSFPTTIEKLVSIFKSSLKSLPQDIPNEIVNWAMTELPALGKNLLNQFGKSNGLSDFEISLYSSAVGKDVSSVTVNVKKNGLEDNSSDRPFTLSIDKVRVKEDDIKGVSFDFTKPGITYKQLEVVLNNIESHAKNIKKYIQDVERAANIVKVVSSSVEQIGKAIYSRPNPDTAIKARVVRVSLTIINGIINTYINHYVINSIKTYISTIKGLVAVINAGLNS